MHAVLLTLLMSGLGHIYCGQLVAGLAWAAAGSFSGVISLWALATQDVGFTLGSLPMVFVTVAAVAHVWSTASHCPQGYRLKSFNHSSVYVLLVAISSFGVVGYAQLIRTKVVEAYFIPTNSMYPTLRVGDRFLVDKTAYRDSPVGVGDLVVFKNPAKPKITWVKRVVALAGDRVEIRDGQLIVNGEPASGKIADRSEGEPSPDFAEFVVPDYNCFVMGDNRSNSRDSRHIGPIPYATVFGKAGTIFWPAEEWSRWGRIE
jgi:signal peptidase I